MNGLYVIVSVVGLSSEKAVSVVTDIAKKYGSKGNVIYEISRKLESVIPAIRQHDPTGVILVCVSKPSDLQKVVLDRENIGISVYTTCRKSGFEFRGVIDQFGSVAVVTIGGADSSTSSEEWSAWASWASERSISCLAGTLSNVGLGSMLNSFAIKEFEFRDSQISVWGQSIRSWLRNQNLQHHVVRGKMRAHADPPAFPPNGVTSQQNLEQMQWQLGLHFTTPDKVSQYNKYVLPKLQELGSNVRFSISSSGNWHWDAGTSSLGSGLNSLVTIVESGDGFFNNYIFPWEKGGSYFSGTDFYGEDGVLGDVSNWESKRPGVFDEVKKVWGFIPEAAADLKITWAKGTASTGTANNVAYRQYTLTGTIDTSGYSQIRNAPKIVGTVRVPSSVTSNCPCTLR